MSQVVEFQVIGANSFSTLSKKYMAGEVQSMTTELWEVLRHERAASGEPMFLLVGEGAPAAEALVPAPHPNTVFLDESDDLSASGLLDGGVEVSQEALDEAEAATRLALESTPDLEVEPVSAPRKVSVGRNRANDTGVQV